MKLVVFGAPISPARGDTRPEAWRALGRALGQLGHRVTFFERRVGSGARDLRPIPGCDLRPYESWDEALPAARRELARADAGIVTSQCPDGLPAAEALLESRAPRRVFYDLDTAATLRQAGARQTSFVRSLALPRFDLVLSVTGGEALERLRSRLGARRVAPLYPWVDPDEHRPVPADPRFRADLACLVPAGPQDARALEPLCFAAALRLPQHRFLIGGPAPATDPTVPGNVAYERVRRADFAAFSCSARLSLHVTRGAIGALGFCPSPELLETAACGVPVLSEPWPWLEAFFVPGEEILVARTTAEVCDALALPAHELARIGAAGRERVLAEHTADCRARELVDLLRAGERPRREDPEAVRDLVAVLRT
ncbi:MAG TPA: glycosyltransferase [Polyangia bacterium]|jgi:spore maturation protein CgeB